MEEENKVEHRKIKGVPNYDILQNPAYLRDF
jgi:hypothetical protein